LITGNAEGTIHTAGDGPMAEVHIVAADRCPLFQMSITTNACFG